MFYFVFISLMILANILVIYLFKKRKKKEIGLKEKLLAFEINRATSKVHGTAFQQKDLTEFVKN